MIKFYVSNISIIQTIRFGGTGACTGVGVHVCVLKRIYKPEGNFDYKASRTVHLVSELTYLGYNVMQRVPGIASTHHNIYPFTGVLGTRLQSSGL